MGIRGLCGEKRKLLIMKKAFDSGLTRVFDKSEIFRQLATDFLAPVAEASALMTAALLP